jgi:hypothetical protein
MRLDELGHIACVGCGRADRPLKPLKGSLWPNARACQECRERYGAEQLAHEADQVLAGATPGRHTPGRCLHCGGPVVADAAGVYAAWCTACETERRALLT